MSVTLQRKPVDLTGWHLTDQAEMVAALTALQADGWRGAITFADGTWLMELNADGPTRQIIATVGDWLVQDMGLRKLTDAERVANYDEVTA